MEKEKSEEKVVNILEKIDNKLDKIEKNTKSKTAYGTVYPILEDQFEKRALALKAKNRLTTLGLIFPIVILSVILGIVMLGSQGDVSAAPGVIFFSIILSGIIHIFRVDPVWLKRQMEIIVKYEKEFGEKIIEKPFKPGGTILEISKALFITAIFLSVIDFAIFSTDYDEFIKTVLFVATTVSYTVSIPSYIFYKIFEKVAEEAKAAIRQKWGDDAI